MSHQTDSIKQVIAEFIPCSHVSLEVKTLQEGLYPSDKKVKGYSGKFSGASINNDIFEFWFEGQNNVFYCFHIKRDKAPLSKNEKRILFNLPEAIRGLHITATNKTEYTQQSITNQFSFPYLWIIQLLRGTNPSRLWTSILSITLLQQLTFERYEGKDCTSGFVCSRILNYLLME